MIRQMFQKYPKIRPLLPLEYMKIYSEHYKQNREGRSFISSLSQKMESWMHQQVANCANNNIINTLEVGAGTLNQLLYENKDQNYDIVEPFSDLYQESHQLNKIRNIYTDISNIPANEKYDRIISIAALEHICDLPSVIARSGVLLSPNGIFQAGVPSEGTWLWDFSWRLISGFAFRLRYGLSHKILREYEHVNNAKEIEEVLEYFFNSVSCKVFGISKSISLYRYYECRNPILERCRNYI